MSPCARRVRIAYKVLAHVAINSVTWSLVVSWPLTMTPSTLMDDSLSMPWIGSGSLVAVRRALGAINIISSDFDWFSLRLFARDQSAMWLRSSSTMRDTTAATIEYVPSA